MSKQLAFLLIVAFFLNLAWEMLQMAAYSEMSRVSWIDSLPTCALASAVDALITLGIYKIGSFIIAQFKITNKGTTSYLLFGFLGTIVAVVLEWLGLYFGRWSYSSSMPVFPMLHVGMLPLLQLTLLVPFSIWVMNKLSSREELLRKSA